MVFDPGKSSLKEINILMNKINALRSDMDGDEKDLLVQHISCIFGRSVMVEGQPVKGLIAVELLVVALNADIALYREKLEKSKLAFQKFQELRRENIAF